MSWPRYSGPPPFSDGREESCLSHSLTRDVVVVQKADFREKQNLPNAMSTQFEFHSDFCSASVSCVQKLERNKGSFSARHRHFLSYVQGACAASKQGSQNKLGNMYRTLLCCCGDVWSQSFLKKKSDVPHYVFYALCASVMCYAMRRGLIVSEVAEKHNCIPGY